MVVTVTGTNVELDQGFSAQVMRFAHGLPHGGSLPPSSKRTKPGPENGMCNELFERIRGFDIVFVADDKQSSVDQRMRLGMCVCFRQLRTCRRARPGQLWAKALNRCAIAR